MEALVIEQSKTGPVLSELPSPVLADAEVLVDVTASSSQRDRSPHRRGHDRRDSCPTSCRPTSAGTCREGTAALNLSQRPVDREFRSWYSQRSTPIGGVIAQNRSNPLALAVLVCLSERPMHPYEVATTLRQRIKHRSVRLNYGALYRVVESLSKRGLIEPTRDRAGRSAARADASTS